MNFTIYWINTATLYLCNEILHAAQRLLKNLSIVKSLQMPFGFINCVKQFLGSNKKHMITSLYV